MTRKEAERQTRQADTLQSLGFTAQEAESLRRISMTLRRWYELECGTGEGQTIISIERDGDEPDSTPYQRIQFPTAHGYADRRYRIADRETGAIKRLKGIVDARNNRALAAIPLPELRKAQRAGGTGFAPLSFYLQTDPRGASLYIIRPGDVPDGANVSSYYSRGIVVY